MSSDDVYVTSLTFHRKATRLVFGKMAVNGTRFDNFDEETLTKLVNERDSANTQQVIKTAVNIRITSEKNHMERSVNLRVKQANM